MSRSLAQEAYERSQLYIGGNWIAPGESRSIDVVDPATESKVGRVPAGNGADVRRATEAATEAFSAWRSADWQVRAELLEAIATSIEERADRFAEVITTEIGMPLKLSRRIQVGLPIASFHLAAELCRGVGDVEEVGNSLILKEPVGIVAAITPWNYPLHQLAAKVAYALAAGCTVVAKPSSVAPLSAFLLADVIHAAGVPNGVFNLVSGTGPEVGIPLVADPNIDMVSFTGSTEAGRHVARVAADGVKRVALELGGKSASVVLDDAELEPAVRHTVNDCLLNSGQTCSALSRLLIDRERVDECAEFAAACAGTFSVGDPFEPDTRLGPVVSLEQRESVRSHIEQGVREGARLVTGGADPPDGCERGYYVRPTVLSDVPPGASVAREEIFGPVLTIIPYDSEMDATTIANATTYGLSGAVWSSDEDRALRVARSLRTGQVSLNGGHFNVGAPFGGVKQSGYGREYGRWGLDEFLVTKAVQR